MYVRSALVLSPLLLVLGDVATASPSESEVAVVAELEPIETDGGVELHRPSAIPIVPPEAEPSIDLDEVRWTVPERDRARNVAQRWGTSVRALAALNPDIRDGDDWVAAGQRLRVYEADQDRPAQSIGAPNRGRLRNGIPLPEGRYWTMRDHRPRAYGTRTTVETLVAVFNAYGETFPGAPPVHLGEISGRRGGRAWPHSSHRTGRDVDIGYIHYPGTLGDRYWRRATQETFDVEKNWFLIKSLIQSGHVQTIFVSSRLQRLLLEEARKELSDEELARYFRRANPDYSEHSIIRYWRGHHDHMHVRFKCDPGNNRCRAKSR